MGSEEASVGTWVRVREDHRIPQRRGMVGKITGLYGGREYTALDVRFPGGERRLFWPRDLEKAPSPRPRWVSFSKETSLSV